jgi:hypothetical protein
MCDLQTRGHTDDVRTVDGQTVAGAAIVYVCLSLLGDSRCRQSLALGSVSFMWLIVVWSPQYGCTGDLPRNPDVRSNGVDSFDSMLLVIRATTDP